MTKRNLFEQQGSNVDRRIGNFGWVKDRSCAPCLCDVIRVDGTSSMDLELYLEFSFHLVLVGSLPPLDLV